MLQLPVIRQKPPLDQEIEKMPSQQYFSKTDIDKNDLIQASSSKPSIAQKRFEKSLQKAVQFLLNKSRTP